MRRVCKKYSKLILPHPIIIKFIKIVNANNTPIIFTLFICPAKKKKPLNKLTKIKPKQAVFHKKPTKIHKLNKIVITTTEVHIKCAEGRPISIPFCMKALRCNISPVAKNKKARAKIIRSTKIRTFKLLLSRNFIKKKYHQSMSKMFGDPRCFWRNQTILPMR